MTYSAVETTERRAGGVLPRLGFLGLGWIGHARLRSLVERGEAVIAAVADPSPAARDAARGLADEARALSDLDEMLEMELDGVVVATPPALHEEQVAAALARRLPVFCQKPLATDLGGTRRVLEAARSADRLLAVDMSYRRARAVMTAEEVIRSGAVGAVFAVEAAFHNPYRPAQAWSNRLEVAGGGCLLDLGTHLIDLALAGLGLGEVASLTAALFESGAPVAHLVRPEDYAMITFRLDGGGVASVVTSWEQEVEQAVIRLVYRGSRGAVQVRNVGGSFYDFETVLSQDGRDELISRPPDNWGGRLLIEWARRLAHGDNRYDAGIESLERVAHVVDRAYGRSP